MNPEVSRSIEVSLTKKDFLDFSMFALKQRHYLRSWRIASVIGTLMLLVLAAACIADPAKFDRTAALLMVFTGAFVPSPWWYAALLRTLSRRQINRPGFEIRFLPWRFSLTSDGIDYRCSMETGLMRWEAIRDVHSTDEAAYAFVTPDHAYIFPRRAFADSAAFEDFVSILKARRAQTSADGVLAPKDRTVRRFAISMAVGVLIGILAHFWPMIVGCGKC